MPTMSISVVKGRGHIAHNNRKFLSQNIAEDRVHNNICYKQEPLQDAYERLFGVELARYNALQKRADRRISDYILNSAWKNNIQEKTIN